MNEVSIQEDPDIKDKHREVSKSYRNYVGFSLLLLLVFLTGLVFGRITAPNLQSKNYVNNPSPVGIHMSPSISRIIPTNNDTS